MINITPNQLSLLINAIIAIFQVIADVVKNFKEAK